MHRSGSSCTTGCVHICGASLGKHPTTIKNKHNPKGYFENRRILEFNMGTLQNIGSSWNNTNFLSDAQIKKSLSHKKTLCKIIEEEFNTPLFAIKDPRIAILQDLYLDVLKDVDVKILFLTRNPESVCKSLKIAQNVRHDKCVQLTNLYHTYINKMTSHIPFKEIRFEDLLDNPVQVMEGVCKFIGIKFKHEKEILQFVEKKIVHFP